MCSANWRADIEALTFRPPHHIGSCMIHRLAFRTLTGSKPTPEECLAYFAEHQRAFDAAALA